jgi:molybdopterin molybdotransferase
MAELTPVEVASERILQRISMLASEEVPVEDAFGRCLGDDFVATRTLPPADNSAMDGYAVRSADLKQVPVTLQVVGRVFPGQAPGFEVGPAQCARIMTGATVPQGADAVVMQEKTKALSETQVEILEAAAARLNVRERGEDALEGARLLPKGTAVGVAEQALLWAQGQTEVKVVRRPRVAIVTSGDELADVGAPHGGKIYDTNSPALAALVRRAGGIPRKLGIAPDRLEAVRQKIETGLSPDFDVLIAVAGMSVGERDYVKDVLSMLGVQLDFWRVAMKPGKPLAFGTRGSSLVFGLPGNPISAMVTFEIFVRPALRKLQGLSPELPLLSGVLAEPVKKAAGLRHFLRARASYEEGRLMVRPLKSQTSGALTSAVGATHLISIPPEVKELAAGAEVAVIPVSWVA